MAAIHIDEVSGSDNEGLGTPDSPYRTLGYAIFSSPGASSYLVRKETTGDYVEPTQSSLKKAKKTAEGLEKKKKKAEELRDQESARGNEEKEKREKLLEESKNVALAEDDTLPKATRVRSQSQFVLVQTHPSFARSKSPN